MLLVPRDRPGEEQDAPISKTHCQGISITSMPFLNLTPLARSCDSEYTPEPAMTDLTLPQVIGIKRLVPVNNAEMPHEF